MVTFSIANAKDDNDLRDRMQQDLIEGDITVSFRRNPSFFNGSAVQGEKAQVIKCLDENNQLIGLGSRIILNTYVNGKVSLTGYLSDLRLKSEYRGGVILQRAYRFLKQCHDIEPVALYYTMILENNHNALRALTRSRCDLPHYCDIGKYVTPAIYLDVPKRSISLPGVICRRAEDNDMKEIFKFMEKTAPQKQFSPVISMSDMQTGRLRGLSANDFYIAHKCNKIVGVIAAWDQTAFRQTYIEKYNKTLRLLRPIYNILSKFSSFKALPAPGDKIPYFYLAFIHIRQNKPEIFRCLLRYMYNDRRKGNWNYFIAGLHQDDPLSSILSEYRRIKVAGNMYVVHYDENENDYRNLDDRIPYVEISMI